MLMMTKKEQEEPPSSTAPPVNGGAKERNGKNGLLSRLKKVLRHRPDTTLREALEEYIGESGPQAEDISASVAEHEKTLISNILKLRDHTVTDVMIPRADIVALEVGATHKEILALLAERQYSRLPVYRETLDQILGTVHIKDILACLARGEKVKLESLIREAMIVSPAMHILDLLLQMRQSRRHLAMVVDEFGGIDGLVTIGDVLEAIIGEIEDEHDIAEEEPQLVPEENGAYIADARVDIDEFEERFGPILSEEDREESDTLGGLVFSLAGRVPARGEILTHNNGMVFEVLDADPRRVNRLRISNIPTALG